MCLPSIIDDNNLSILSLNIDRIIITIKNRVDKNTLSILIESNNNNNGISVIAIENRVVGSKSLLLC